MRFLCLISVIGLVGCTTISIKQKKEVIDLKRGRQIQLEAVQVKEMLSPFVTASSQA